MPYSNCDGRMRYPAYPPCYIYGACPYMHYSMQGGGYAQYPYMMSPYMMSPYMGGMYGMYGGMGMYGQPPMTRGLGSSDAMVEDVDDEE